MTAAKMFKQACRLHLNFAIHRYLMSNASGRMDGHEKAQRHIELCTFYVAAVRGVDDLDMVRRGLDCHEDDYQAVHDATQALTDHLDEAIGFPLECPMPLQSKTNFEKSTINRCLEFLVITNCWLQRLLNLQQFGSSELN